MRGIKIAIFLAMAILFAATQPGWSGQGQMGGGQGDPMRGAQQGPAMGHETPGIPVLNQQGQELGRVIALATKNNQPTYFLVARNGSERELTPIPVDAALLDQQTNTIVLLGMADSELAQAPSLSVDELQRLDDPEFERQVHSYYGQGDLQQPELGGQQPEEEAGRISVPTSS